MTLATASHDAPPSSPARTYQIRTHGCQMNVHDSERLAGLLEGAGYAKAGDADQADVVVMLKPGLDVAQRSGVRYENWPLPDPQGWDLDGIRGLRDHLDARITQLLTDLAPLHDPLPDPVALDDEDTR